MFKVADNLWVGNSDDEKQALQYTERGLVDSMLVVAHDMTPTGGWQYGVETWQIGLVDGPGNPLAAYHAAVLALVSLLRRGKVLVCCHSMSRSLVVAIMYLYLIGDGPSWDEYIDRLNMDIDLVVPDIHSAHREAFFLMDWGMLTRVLEGEV